MRTHDTFLSLAASGVLLLGSGNIALALDQFDTLSAFATKAYEEENYLQVEKLLKQCLDLAEKSPDAASGNKVLTSLLRLASFFAQQGRFSDAEPYSKKALAIREGRLGKDHPDVARSYMDLAALEARLGQPEQAESLLLQALDIRVRNLAPGATETTRTYWALADLYQSQKRSAEAEKALQDALTVNEKAHGEGSTDVAACLDGIASLYVSAQRPADAEAQLRKALSLRENLFGPSSLELVPTMLAIAEARSLQNDKAGAGAVRKQVEKLRELVYAAGGPDDATTLSIMSATYIASGDANDLEKKLLKLIADKEAKPATKKLDLAPAYRNLADFYEKMLSRDKEGQAYKKALEIYASNAQCDFRDRAATLEGYSELLRKQKKEAEANQVQAEAKRLREQGKVASK